MPYERLAAANMRRNVRRRHARLIGLAYLLGLRDDGCGDNAELSDIDGQSLPTVTNEYRSNGSGLENTRKLWRV